MSAKSSKQSKQTALPCEVVKKYPGPEQVQLSVVIEVPGRWFNAIPTYEKAKTFLATAVQYSICHQFGNGRNAVKTEAIRFQVEDDVLDAPDHEGYPTGPVEQIPPRYL
ncbi:hypothetical protein CYMTET_21224 [Cymbomonas tetramitiformis]|uniref:Uncharacterized protein n=1 Tax=Cymbomonas tetramitiformis TaxID=36881 RepID=A0AAE0G2J2_9CHLO|nr:hypothetical protein CYMTET_21224 [Cymbomonas tetramitiformis]